MKNHCNCIFMSALNCLFSSIGSSMWARDVLSRLSSFDNSMQGRVGTSRAHNSSAFSPFFSLSFFFCNSFQLCFSSSSFLLKAFQRLLFFLFLFLAVLTKLLHLLLMTFRFCKEFDEKFSGSCFDEKFRSLGFHWNIQSAEESTELRSSLERKWKVIIYYNQPTKPTQPASPTKPWFYLWIILTVCWSSWKVLGAFKVF